MSFAGYTYNGVFIQYCRTLRFEWEQERDPTGTDALYSKYTIRVRGFLATQAGGFPGIGDSISSAETINVIKAQLQTPRKQMSYLIGDQTLVQVASGEVDDKLGPAPMPASVTEVSPGTFAVECGCVVYVLDCSSECTSFDPIVSNRWTQTETFDQNWNSKLVTSGKLIVRASLLQSADIFRATVTPPVIRDYIRKVSKYTINPNGLEMDYYFEDEEQDRLPPFPATTASGSYSVVVEKPGFKRFGTVRIRLEGQKGTSRKVLLLKAVAMAYSKLEADKFFVDDKGNTVKLIWGKFDEDLFEPAVEVTMTAQMTNTAVGGVIRVPGRIELPSIPSWSDFFGGSPDGSVLGPLGGVAVAAGGAGVVPAAPIAAAPVGGPADDAAAAIVAAVMPSVGQSTYGLQYGQPGIAPPDRKRIKALLTSIFRDPCLCVD